MINTLLKILGLKLIRISPKPETLIEQKNYNSKQNLPIFIKTDDIGNLYQCAYDMKLYLDPVSYVDSMILKNNVWEKESMDIVQMLVKTGDTVLDVGANFGYYSVMCSKLVGANGQVISSEPTAYFRERFTHHISKNNCSNITLLPFGFSDKENTLEIKIDASTATMHMPEQDAYLKTEQIKLVTLDSYIKDNKVDKLDFIKVDIDGHEPKFLNGAEQTISKFKPYILLEINPLNYYLAGVTIWDFYEQIKDYGYRIFEEKSKEEIKDKIDFLKRCGNFGWQGNWKAPFSVNVLLSTSNPFGTN